MMFKSETFIAGSWAFVYVQIWLETAMRILFRDKNIKPETNLNISWSLQRQTKHMDCFHRFSLTVRKEHDPDGWVCSLGSTLNPRWVGTGALQRARCSTMERPEAGFLYFSQHATRFTANSKINERLTNSRIKPQTWSYSSLSYTVACSSVLFQTTQINLDKVPVS